MREYERETMIESCNVQSLLQVLRAAGAVLGIIAMIFGLVYATRLFALIFATLRAPERCQTLVSAWVTAVGGGELDIVLSGTTYHCANIVAIAILGGVWRNDPCMVILGADLGWRQDRIVDLK